MSKNRDIAAFLGKTENENTDNASLFDGGAGARTASYGGLDSLPVTNLTSGDMAYVEENRRLYVSDGNGWYNAALFNRGPRWDSGGEPEASYDIVDSATPLVITARAIDSDNVNFINQSIATDSAQYMVNIINDSSVFTFIPKSADSIGIEVAAGNLTDSNGDFTYTFKWSDGINFVSKAVTIAYGVINSGIAWGGDRALTFGGLGTGAGDTISYYSNATSGNAIDFGNLPITSTNNTPPVSSKTRAVASNTSFGTGVTNSMYYVTIATPGNAVIFGDQHTARKDVGAASNGYKGIFASGFDDPTGIEYITIDTTGNALDFGGVLIEQHAYPTLSTTGDATRGLFGGGFGPSNVKTNGIEYITFDVPSNGTSFGDLSAAKTSMAGMTDETRSIFAGGYSTTYVSAIEYVTTQTLGNAASLGTLSPALTGASGTSNGVNGTISGGNSGSSTNVIEQYGIQTLGSGIDWGDLLVNTSSHGSTSGAA